MSARPPHDSDDPADPADPENPGDPNATPDLPTPPADAGDRFAYIEVVGRGGMGVVWRAHDRLLQRIVAIKILKPEFAAQPEWVARAPDAQAPARLSSPFVAQVHDVIVAERKIVGEFVDGESLAARLRRRGALPASEVLAIASAIARGLDAAHRVGIVHRDLKPGNVMIPLDAGCDGTVAAKLIDWGLALCEPTPLGRGDARDRFRFAGTPPYMAPERFDGSAGPHADLWALGCVVFECLTGRRAFAGRGRDLEQAILAGAFERDAPQLAASPPLRELVHRCVVVDRSQRAASAEEVLAILDAARRPSASRRRRRAPPPPLGESPVERREIVDDAARALRAGRAVAVIGPIGVGKSWIGRATIERLRGERRVVHVDLATEGTAPLRAIAAEALGLEDASRLDALADRPLEPTLLVLDNADAYRDDVDDIETALRSSGVALLATLRRPPHGEAWTVVPVDPLACPPERGDRAAKTIESYDAVRLFVAMARRRRRAFTIDATNAHAIAAVCRALDGLPGALALVAAHARYLEPADLREELAVVLSPTRAEGADGAERTFSGTVAWSIDRLRPSTRRLLERLALFAGSWSLPTARAVCAETPEEEGALHEDLRELVDEGLIRHESGRGRSRYRVPETVRAALAERSEAGPPPEARRRFESRRLERCRELVFEAYPGLARDAATPNPRSLPIWLERMELEVADCVAAIAWALDAAPDRIPEAVDLALGLQEYWYDRGLRREGIDVLTPLLERWSERGDIRAVRLISARAKLLFPGDRPAALDEYRRALDRLRAIVAGSASDESSTARLRLAALLNNIALLLVQTGDTRAARAMLAESRTIYGAAGREDLVAATELSRGILELAEGGIADAETALHSALARFERTGDTVRQASALHYLARARLAVGDRAAARTRSREALALRRATGDLDGIAESLRLEGELCADSGRLDDAAFLLGASAARRGWIGARIPLNEEPAHRAAVEATRAGLGAERFAASFAAGESAAESEISSRLDPA